MKGQSGRLESVLLTINVLKNVYFCKMFTPLNYPKTELKLTKKGADIFVWCEFRKRRLLVTPEEWVRQHVLHFLVKEKSFPLSLIASEYAIEVNGLDRRCDAVAFDRTAKPVLIVECKAPQIKLTESIFHQIAQYNFKLRVQWLIMTNGLQTIVAKVNQQTGEILYFQEIPDYAELAE